MTIKVTNMDLIQAFINRDKLIDNMRTPASKSQVRFQGGQLVRVWNDGRGLITLAERDTDNTYLNSLFLKKVELETIKSAYQEVIMVDLGYPDYYTHGLKSLHTKRLTEEL